MEEGLDDLYVLYFSGESHGSAGLTEAENLEINIAEAIVNNLEAGHER